MFCDRERIHLEILTDIHVFSTPKYEKLVLEFVLCICVFAFLPPEQLGRFYPSLIHNISSIIGRFSLNMYILAQNIRAHQRLSLTYFLKLALTVLIHCQ
jgi:hypothetical protein